MDNNKIKEYIERLSEEEKDCIRRIMTEEKKMLIFSSFNDEKIVEEIKKIIEGVRK